jgi:hypothetical protein
LSSAAVKAGKETFASKSGRARLRSRPEASKRRPSTAPLRRLTETAVRSSSEKAASMSSKSASSVIAWDRPAKRPSAANFTRHGKGLSRLKSSTDKKTWRKVLSKPRAGSTTHRALEADLIGGGGGGEQTPPPRAQDHEHLFRFQRPSGRW